VRVNRNPFAGPALNHDGLMAAALDGLDQSLIDPFPVQNAASSRLPRGLEYLPAISLMVIPVD
jgi:hypothetical protein